MQQPRFDRGDQRLGIAPQTVAGERPGASRPAVPGQDPVVNSSPQVSRRSRFGVVDGVPVQSIACLVGEIPQRTAPKRRAVRRKRARVAKCRAEIRHEIQRARRVRARGAHSDLANRFRRKVRPPPVALDLRSSFQHGQVRKIGKRRGDDAQRRPNAQIEGDGRALGLDVAPRDLGSDRQLRDVRSLRFSEIVAEPSTVEQSFHGTWRAGAPGRL